MTRQVSWKRTWPRHSGPLTFLELVQVAQLKREASDRRACSFRTPLHAPTLPVLPSRLARPGCSDLLRNYSGARTGFDRDPGKLELPPEPRHLAFSKLAGADFNQLHRALERPFASEVFRYLPIAQRLHGRSILRQATPEELLCFGHQAKAEHLFDSRVDPPAQFGQRTAEAASEYPMSGVCARPMPVRTLL